VGVQDPTPRIQAAIMGDAHTPALLAAFAVALSARTGTLTAQVVDDMRARAEELLPRDHALRPAIMGFCTMYELRKRNAAQLVELGAELQRNLDRATAPPVAFRERKDTDG
jgi:hypothetical protein